MNTTVRVRSRAISSAAAAETATCRSANRESLPRRLTCLGATGGSVWQTLNEYVSEGNFVKKYDLWSSVKQLRRFGKFRQALQIMEWMEMRKIEYSHSDHSMRLDLIYKTKGVAEAENYMGNLPPHAKDKFTFGALLNCYCMDSMEHKALLVFEEMSRSGFVTNALPFGNLMTMYTKMGKYEKVPSLVQEMKHRKIPMSTYTYNILMQSYAALDDIAGVERVWAEVKMVERQNLDWTTYSNLATIYVKAGRFEKAKVPLQKLEEHMRPGTREAFHFLISLYARIGQPDEVCRVWKSLNSVHPTFNNVSYLVMLQALAKLDDVEGLKKCFQEWLSGYSHYDTRLLNTVIGAYLRKSMYEEAVLLFEDATTRTKGPFFNTRERFIFFFLENGQVDLALSYLEANVSRAKDYKWLSPQLELVSTLLNYFEKAKDVDGAERVLNILKPIHRPTANDYRSLLKVYDAAGKFAPEMRSRLDLDGIEISGEVEELLQRVCPKL